MTWTELLWFLVRYGHFANPAVIAEFGPLPTLHVALGLPEGHPHAMAAVASLQDFDLNFHNLALQYHGRLGIVDGDVGPATLALAEMPRCAMPDYGREGTGSGSWRPGCVDGKPNDQHWITIGVNESTMPAKVKPWWEEIKARCDRAYRAVGIGFVWRDWKGRPSGHVDMWWRSLGGSTIGLAEYNNQSCGDNVFCNLNPNYTPSLHMVSVLTAHELGHNNNLPHTSGGIMNPSILNVRDPISWAGDPSANRLRGFYGGEPIPDDDDDPPGPPGPPPGVEFRILSDGQTLEHIPSGDTVKLGIYFELRS